jgi:hypothetical protein
MASPIRAVVDLLMLHPLLERLVAIEVKSTIQLGRWPRLATGRNEQLTPAWFDAPGNQGITEWEWVPLISTR